MLPTTVPPPPLLATGLLRSRLSFLILLVLMTCQLKNWGIMLAITKFNTHNAQMFYIFFESRNSKNDPVVIWLTGGPGCSSELALFYENGPFKVEDDSTLVWNEYGWDKVTFSCFNSSRHT